MLHPIMDLPPDVFGTRENQRRRLLINLDGNSPLQATAYDHVGPFDLNDNVAAFSPSRISNAATTNTIYGPVQYAPVHS
jgi:hypothetical protein